MPPAEAAPSGPPPSSLQHVATVAPPDLPEPGHVRVTGEVVLSRAPDGSLQAARNRCRHQAGRFPLGDDPVLECPRHGWCLDAKTMAYTNPTGGLCQATLTVRPGPDGSMALYEVTSRAPWELDGRPPAPLERGELTVTYLTHACAEIACGPWTIVTDPWLEGPAFTRGWWLADRPPDDWPDRLAQADVVYLSHNHSDHLHRATLARLALEQPGVRVVVPELPGGSCEALVRRAGLHNVVSLVPGAWLDLDADTRLTLLADGSGREDTALLVDHRGHLVLDIVDCADPNGGVLPAQVDVLLAPFAGGASGYPLCWPDQYPEAEIQRRLAVARSTLATRACELAAATSARVHVPFAGSFTEAHPADAALRRRNAKNRPEDVAALVERRSPGTRSWVPRPGERLDVATGATTRTADGPRRHRAEERAAEIERFVPEITAALDFEPLTGLDGVQRYIHWLDYRGDAVLHVIETDDSFETVRREYHVDLLDGVVAGGAPSRGRGRLLRMRVRADSLRHVMRRGLGWEELTIGFQARCYREPDTYDLDFWNHVQNRLPAEPPWGQEEPDAGG